MTAMRIFLFLSAFLAAFSGGIVHAPVAGPTAELSASLSVKAERPARPFVAQAHVDILHNDVSVPRPSVAPVRMLPLYADRMLI